MKNKILSLILVVALVVCGAAALVKNNEAADVKAQLEAVHAQVAELTEAAAAVETVQAQLDEANAKIAELEAAAANAVDAAELQAQIDLYKPYYDEEVVVEYNGGVVMEDDVMAIYADMESYYAQYGIDLVSYGLEAQVKEMAAQEVLEMQITAAKAAELGLDQMDEETAAGLTEEAAVIYESYIEAVKSQFETEEATEEEVRAQSEEYLASMSYSVESIHEALVDEYVYEQLYNYVTAGVTVSEEDVQAAFDALVAEQETSFASDSSYNSARNDGEMIVWNPEGYRAVKHVLIKLTDEQSAAYDELESTLNTLNAELEAAQAPAEESEEETEEETEVRTVEEISADIAATQAEMDAIYAELLPRATEVIDKFNAGTPFADLIAEYNEDPGMTNEPTATNGYAVAATSTIWDPAFTAGAMSIESVGGISEPVYGSYGIHIIYYESDIPAGPVDYASVSESLAASALTDKISQTYTDAVNQWIADAAPVFHQG